MSLGMHAASLPVFDRMLGNLAGILAKADAHCAAKKIDPAVLCQARLFPDMFPLTRQVFIAGDFAKNTAARLAGVDAPKYDDVEATLAELKARVEKTQAYVRTFKAEQIDGSETRQITIPIRGQPMTFDGRTYLLNFALPNFYFHCATAYNILRHCGVEIGKGDFLGAA